MAQYCLVTVPVLTTFIITKIRAVFQLSASKLLKEFLARAGMQFGLEFISRNFHLLMPLILRHTKEEK